MAGELQNPPIFLLKQMVSQPQKVQKEHIIGSRRDKCVLLRVNIGNI